MTSATTLENPAFLTSCWITSMHEGIGSLDHNETSAHGAEPADSTLEEAREVCRPAEIKDWQTTLSEASPEPPGPRGALS